MMSSTGLLRNEPIYIWIDIQGQKSIWGGIMRKEDVFFLISQLLSSVEYYKKTTNKTYHAISHRILVRWCVFSIIKETSYLRGTAKRSMLNRDYRHLK